MKKKIAVFPLYKADSAFFEITRICMQDERVELVDFCDIENNFKKYKELDAVFLSFYESVFAKPPFIVLKKLIKIVLKMLSISYLKRKHCKIVYYIHNLEAHDKEERIITRLLFKYLIKKADKIIILCQDTKKHLAKIEYRDEIVGKAVYIPHPEYSYVYKHPKLVNFRKETGIKDSEFVVLLFGAIRPYKNIELWLEVATNFEGSNIRFLLAGTGKNKNYLSHIKDLCKLHPNVVFINRFIKNEEMASLLSGVNILTLPYDKGSLNSGPVLAALTFGIPVICPEIGSAHDYNQEYFYEYDYEDEETHVQNLTSEIKKAYKKITENQSKQEKLKKQMILDIQANASIESNKVRYQELYNELFGFSKGVG